ncbi:MAG: MFS transporter [Alphaproteobacteria bacterium]
MTGQLETLSPRKGVQLISVIGIGHFFSHFYGIALPPLFPFLQTALNVGFADLGVLVAAFYLASGSLQVPMGILVDRFGPAKVLILGITIQAIAILFMGMASSYWIIFILVLLLGAGNSVYHPADYAILAARVPAQRLGLAFSIHTFSGHLGWAAAPVAMGFIALNYGWQMALIVAGIGGLIAATLLLSNRRLLGMGALTALPTQSSKKSSFGLAQILTRPILACFVFFMLFSMALTGFQSFFVSAAHAWHNTPIGDANLGLTCFFIGSATGLLLGGVAADRGITPVIIATFGFGASALGILLVGYFGPAGLLLAGSLAVTGFGHGAVAPSRDLLVRSVTPPGATGKVFGFVSVGLDIGSISTPLLYGWIMDHGGPQWIYWLSAAIMISGIATVVFAGRMRQRHQGMKEQAAT